MLNLQEKVINLGWPGFICSISILCISIYGWDRVQSIDTPILEIQLEQKKKKNQKIKEGCETMRQNLLTQEKFNIKEREREREEEEEEEEEGRH